MVSNDAAPAAGLLPDGVRYCDCDAARFGWWGGQIGIVSGPQGARADALFPGTFVVGDLPGIAEIPNEGTASYTGHAAAAIRNAGAAYAAVGHFTMDWSFATRSGEVGINRLDNRSYAAPVGAAPANPRDFSGALINVAGAAASGDLNGILLRRPRQSGGRRGWQVRGADAGRHVQRGRSVCSHIAVTRDDAAPERHFRVGR